MGFIGIFFILILFIIYCCSLFILIVSTVLFIVGSLKKDKSRAFQIIRIVCIPVMCLSAIPTIVLAVLIIINLVFAATVPSDYVELEEMTLHEAGFNVDDETYILVDYSLYQYEKEGVPVFSYKPDGLFKKHEWRNVFAFELKSGFVIYRLDLDEMNRFYYIEESSSTSFDDYYYQHTYWDCESDSQNDLLASEMSSILNKYLLINEEAIQFENTQTGVSFTRYSSDLELRLNKYSLEYQEDKIYLCTKTIYDLDEHCFYDYGFELTENEKNIVGHFLEANEEKLYARKDE